MNNIIKYEPNKIRRKIISDTTEMKRTKIEFLAVCKIELEQEDYMDLLCAILDKEIFDTVDDDMKNLVDVYYELV